MRPDPHTDALPGPRPAPKPGPWQPSRRRAFALLAAAIGALLCGLFGAALYPPESSGQSLLAIGGCVGFGALVRGSMLCLRRDWDELWRDSNAWIRTPRPARGRKLRVAALASVAIGTFGVARAQQTIFNVPSADVLDEGKTYVEADALWRPSDPRFAVFTVRGTRGLGARFEAGVNFGGFTTPGRSVPIATPNVKWQPYRSGDGNVSVTAGAFGLFFLRGSRDGNPAALGYGHVAVKLPTKTRLTGGGYWGSSGYAAPDVQKGFLGAVEQPVVDGLTIAADWFSGENGLGYFSPGVVVSEGPWSFYGAWSLKNGDSKGNALLLELGITF